LAICNREQIVADRQNPAGNVTGAEGGLISCLLVAAVAVTMLATELTVPSNPSLPDYFLTTDRAVQVSIALNLLGYAVAPPLLGPLSDRFGRRPVLLTALTLFACASALASVASSVEVFTLARMLQGLAGASAPVVGMAIVRDLHDEKGSVKVIAMISMAIAVVPAAGPVIGGYIHSLAGWQANYAALAVAGLLVVLVLALKLPETLASRDLQALRLGKFTSRYGQLLRSRDYVGYALLPTLGFSGMTAFVTGGPFYLIDTAGVSEVGYGLIQAGLVVCYIVGALGASLGINRLGFERVHMIGVVLLALGGAGEALFFTQPFPSPFMFCLPFGLFLVGMGVVFATAPARALAIYPALAGSASAMLTTLEMLGGALASIAVSLMHTGSASATGAVILVSALTAAGVQLLVVPRAAGREA
jgi:DHA1 family bicyclomycin/chloramphenicol resistance-like MFS transporter